MFVCLFLTEENWWIWSFLSSVNSLIACQKEMTALTIDMGINIRAVRKPRKSQVWTTFSSHGLCLKQILPVAFSEHPQRAMLGCFSEQGDSESVTHAFIMPRQSYMPSDDQYGQCRFAYNWRWRHGLLHKGMEKDNLKDDDGASSKCPANLGNSPSGDEY